MRHGFLGTIISGLWLQVLISFLLVLSLDCFLEQLLILTPSTWFLSLCQTFYLVLGLEREGKEVLKQIIILKDMTYFTAVQRKAFMRC